MGRVTVEAQLESIEDLYRVRRGDLSANQVRRITVPEALIDTGATSLSLPRTMIDALGLMQIRSRRVVTTTGITDVNIFGAVQLTIDGRDCLVDAMEIPEECPVLIGQVPLELMDFIVDPNRRRLIGNPAHGGEHMLELL